jgi:predicted transcriptional regulator
MKLSTKEEMLMQHIWKLKNAGMKDIINEYDTPKPATTTIATLLKRMKDKEVIDYRVNGKSREYFALVEKSVYFKSHFRGLMKNFFGNSAASLASFFTSSSDLSTDELKSLREMIDSEIQKKEK